jgi:pilus assembly protein CpaD
MMASRKESVSMTRKTFLALLVIGTAVAGCAAADPEFAAKHNASPYSIHQPVVQRTDYVMDLGTSGTGLASGETPRLRAWFDSLQLRYGDTVAIDGNYDAIAEADIARVAEEYGLLLGDGAPITAGAIQPGAVRVVVSRASASVPSCPDWSYSQLPGAPVSTDSNFGCAINKNLAAMIADPNDLVLGQNGDGSGDAKSASKPIKAYRDRPGSGASGQVKAESIGN